MQMVINKYSHQWQPHKGAEWLAVMHKQNIDNCNDTITNTH